MQGATGDYIRYEFEWPSWYQCGPVYPIITKVPFKCPVCDGQQIVSRPPHVPGDQLEYTASSAGPFPCKVCSGTGIIWGPR